MRARAGTSSGVNVHAHEIITKNRAVQSAPSDIPECINSAPGQQAKKQKLIFLRVIFSTRNYPHLKMATAAACDAGASTSATSLSSKLDAAQALVAKDDAKKKALDNARLVLQQDRQRKVDDLCRWRENKVPREVLCVGCRKERGTWRGDGSRRCTSCEVAHTYALEDSVWLMGFVAIGLTPLALLLASETMTFIRVLFGSFVLFAIGCIGARVAYNEGRAAVMKEGRRVAAFDKAYDTLNTAFARERLAREANATPVSYTPPASSIAHPRPLSTSDMN